MDVKDVSLTNASPLIKDFSRGSVQIEAFFDYTAINEQAFHDRKNSLKNRTFAREALVAHLLSLHQNYEVSEKTVQNIDQLRDPNSMVVVGGQQAGLLTGPLYTVHKVITILKQAKEQEQRLGAPVLPVFWVAGEDHDFDEINHIHIHQTNKIKKHKISQKMYKKAPASHMELDKQKCFEWVEEAFQALGETAFTNEVMDQIAARLNKSTTFVDFFIYMLYLLFPNEGLIVVNANHPELREIERPFFKTLITENKRLTEAVYEQQLQLRAAGYGEPIEINKNNAHLFCLLDEERVLLERDADGQFVGKNNRCLYSAEELITIASDNPALLSNNVVTRPLMQEFLLPVLAFVGGPGEIAYWATLKRAFHLFGFEMPPLVPRLSITFVEEKVSRHLQETAIPIETALTEGTSKARSNWLVQHKPYEIEKPFSDAIAQLETIHRPLRELAVAADPKLQDLAEKNRELITEQLHFLRKKIDKTIEQSLAQELGKFDMIEAHVRPLRQPQERVENILYYLNKYGIDFAEKVSRLDLEVNDKHKVIYI